ncbi:MAG: ABC transporter ATP-binding protein [Deltaproteobacteria bacterium]|nr:ABC transporter ATP-binding protein [Deltaproteobacteria bacterium]
MAQVILNNVQKKYGKVDAVKNLNLECKDKEFLVLLGPSGCGKSSTLRMIAGLEEANAGDILIDGVRVNDIHPSRRDIAMVFETYALYPHKTVFENMAYPLRVRKTSEGEIKSRVQRAAEILGLEALLMRYPRQLSGGQKQRVAIGRAIVRNPKVFLMDEPISHLDAKLRSHMRVELKHLQKELNQTFIYVTHDQTEAMSMADRIAVMHSGELQQFGTPDTIYNQPVNSFVAGFVGDPPMNFIPCVLQFERGGWTLKHDAFLLRLDDSIAARITVKGEAANGHQEVILGIRPEAISLKTEKSKPEEIPGNIYITEPMGSYTIVDVQVGTERLRVRADAHFQGDVGKRVFAEISPEDFHLFSVSSTCSLL